jgi:hypothetical protein
MEKIVDLNKYRKKKYDNTIADIIQQLINETKYVIKTIKSEYPLTIIPGFSDTEKP